MELNLLQNILLILLAGLVPVDKYGMTFGLRWPVITSLFAGLIVGDMQTAMFVGGTLQLMSLGVASIGGSSVPEYGVGAVIAIAVASTTGGGVEAGLAIGIPVAMLMVQFDVIAKVSQTFIVRKAQEFANDKKFTKMYRTLLCGPVLMFLTGAIPVGIALLIGPAVVDSILSSMPTWFTGGLTIASKLLPVVGVALLFNYMPTEKYFPAIILGFFLPAYLGVSMMGVAILGIAIAIVFYKYKTTNTVSTLNDGGLEDE